jgi:hypothetical protein
MKFRPTLGFQLGPWFDVILQARSCRLLLVLIPPMAFRDVIAAQLGRDWEVAAGTVPVEGRLRSCQITVVTGGAIGMVFYPQALLRAIVDVSYCASREKRARRGNA